MRIAPAMLVMVLVFATAANALSASIQPPKMVLRGNISDMLNVYVDTRNPNEFPVTVNVTLAGLDNVKVVEGPSFFELAPNESRRVFLEVTIAKPGTSAGEAQFIFYPAEKQERERLQRGLALASQIVMIAPGETPPAEPTATTIIAPQGEIPAPEFVNVMLVIGAIITGVLLFTFFRR